MWRYMRGDLMHLEMRRLEAALLTLGVLFGVNAVEGPQDPPRDAVAEEIAQTPGQLNQSAQELLSQAVAAHNPRVLVSPEVVSEASSRWFSPEPVFAQEPVIMQEPLSATSPLADSPADSSSNWISQDAMFPPGAVSATSPLAGSLTDSSQLPALATNMPVASYLALAQADRLRALRTPFSDIHTKATPPAAPTAAYTALSEALGFKVRTPTPTPFNKWDLLARLVEPDGEKVEGLHQISEAGEEVGKEIGEDDIE
jgi:hypothetical protein